MLEEDLPKIFDPFFATKRGGDRGGAQHHKRAHRQARRELPMMGQVDKGTQVIVELPLRLMGGQGEAVRPPDRG